MNTKTLSITINDELISYNDDQINVVIPPYVRRICAGSISCSNAISLFIPKYVFQIDDLSLSTLNKLQTITVHPENKHFKVINNCLVETSTKKLIISAKGGTVPNDDSVNIISAYAFKNRNDLTQITIPDTIKSIGQNAFEGCKNLKKVVLPKHLQTIKENTFYKCTKLTNVKFPTTLKEIGSNVFNKCTNLKCVVIPKTTGQIGEGAFNCANLETVCLPTGVKNIHEKTFDFSAPITIYGRSDTFAEHYAKSQKINFVVTSSYKKFDVAA